MTSLLVPPLTFAASTSGFGVNCILADGSVGDLGLYVLDSDGNSSIRLSPVAPATDCAQWSVGDLQPFQKHTYLVVDADENVLATNSVQTGRALTDSFVSALISDTHIDVGTESQILNYDNNRRLQVVSSMMRAAEASFDWILNCGDVYEFLPFISVPPDAATARQAIVNYRQCLGLTSSHAHVLGNWDSEGGDLGASADLMRTARKIYLPHALGNYPAGLDMYYAFEWGPLLSVVLDVMTYTTSAHLLSHTPNALNWDWEIGPDQLSWLKDTLASSNCPFVAVYCHHPFGGAVENDAENSAYGRGSGEACFVGRQHDVHTLLCQYGAMWFQGHDHNFLHQMQNNVPYVTLGRPGYTYSDPTYGSNQYGYSRLSVTPESVTLSTYNFGIEAAAVVLPLKG